MIATISEEYPVWYVPNETFAIQYPLSSFILRNEPLTKDSKSVDEPDHRPNVSYVRYRYFFRYRYGQLIPLTYRWSLFGATSL